MLADISGEELERWLTENNLIAKDDAPVDVPLNAPCADHGEVASTPITLRR